METSNQKRKYKRVNEKFNVRIVKEISESELVYLNIEKIETINVAAGGLLVHIKEPIDIDAIVKISFIKPKSFDVLEMKGKVVRVENMMDGSYSLAIVFISLSEKDKRDLAYYIDLLDN